MPAKQYHLALKLSDLGNKDKLNKRIDKHFQDHPAEKDIPRFAPLLQLSTGRSWHQATPQPLSEEQLGNNQNEPPSTSTVLPNDSPHAGPLQHPNPYIYLGKNQYHFLQVSPHQYSQYYSYSMPSTSTGTASAIPNPLHYYAQGNYYNTTWSYY